MTDQAPQFELTAPPAGLLTLDQAARSFGVTRQAFHRWNVQPVRVQGTRRLYDLAAVLQNRIEHAAEADRTPEDAEIDRYQARIDLLTEQLEHQRLKNQAQRQRYAHNAVGEWVLSHLMDQAARILEGIPAAVLEASPKATDAETLLTDEAGKAGEILRRAEIEHEPDTGNGERYT